MQFPHVFAPHCFTARPRLGTGVRPPRPRPHRRPASTLTCVVDSVPDPSPPLLPPPSPAPAPAPRNQRLQFWHLPCSCTTASCVAGCLGYSGLALPAFSLFLVDDSTTRRPRARAQFLEMTGLEPRLPLTGGNPGREGIEPAGRNHWGCASGYSEKGPGACVFRVLIQHV